MSDARVRRLVLGGQAADWEKAGFEVADDGRVNVGAVGIEIEDGRRGMEWELSGVATTELDGLATRLGDAPARRAGDPSQWRDLDRPRGGLQP